MDNWNHENNQEPDMTLNGQFHDNGQQGDNPAQGGSQPQENSYGQNAYNQPENNYGQNTYNSYGQNMYNGQSYQSGYGQSSDMGGYGQPYPNYQQPGQGAGYHPAEMEEPVGMGEWTGLLAILTFVPCIGVILAIVWAFGKSEKKSKANFCKAYLIIWLIKLAIYMLIFIIWGSALIAVIGNF